MVSLLSSDIDKVFMYLVSDFITIPFISIEVLSKARAVEYSTCLQQLRLKRCMVWSTLMIARVAMDCPR